MKKTSLILSLASCVLLFGCSTQKSIPSESTETTTMIEQTSETGSSTTTTTDSVNTGSTSSTSDIASYTLAQVATHASETDCWTVINGNVYDITSYVPKHPGGVQQIMRVCGTDGTQAFVRKHDGDTRPKDVLVDFKIGVLAQ